MTRDFYPGTSPELAQIGRERYLASGRTFATGPRFADDDRPLPKGFSLSGLITWHYDQGQVGSCFANMGAMVLQVMMAALLAAGMAGKLFNPSRRLVWYRCRQLDGSIGSWSDGGSIVNSFAALGPAPHGLGDCSESEWPYQASHSWLEATPTATVVSSADHNRVASIAEVEMGDGTPIKRAIFNGSPVGIGVDWCFGWDQGLIDAYGRATDIGRAVGGHAIVVMGWLDDWDGHTWYEIENSHGKIYPALPPEIQALVVGYKPSGFSFWLRDDLLAEVLHRAYAEAYTAAGVSGFTKKVITPIQGLVL